MDSLRRVTSPIRAICQVFGGLFGDSLTYQVQFVNFTYMLLVQKSYQLDSSSGHADRQCVVQSSVGSAAMMAWSELVVM